MNVEKVINNNLVRSIDLNGHEVLVMGCGLGFKKKPGELIDSSKIEKIYFLKSADERNDTEALLSRVSLPVLQAVNEIVGFGQVLMDQKFDITLTTGLADHLEFAVERARKGLTVPNALLGEIRSFYPKEYQTGLEALNIIREKTGAALDENEAGFIALHFANASNDLNGIHQTRDMMDMIQHILQIVQLDTKVQLHEDDVHYARFVTHLKYFFKRMFAQQTSTSEDPGFFQMVKSQYKRAYLTAAKVQDYLHKRYGLDVTEDEMIYLTIHIHRLSDMKRMLTKK